LYWLADLSCWLLADLSCWLLSAGWLTGCWLLAAGWLLPGSSYFYEKTLTQVNPLSDKSDSGRIP
jgi:hypothetical protein